MRVSKVLAALMGAAARRPRAAVLVVSLLALVGAGLALRLEPETSTDTLVGRDTPEYQASERFHERFGDDAVYILVKEDLTKLTGTSDVLRLIGLEGCLSGALPRGTVPAGGAEGPCAKLGRTRPAKVVFGPGTFLNEAVGRIQDEFNRQRTEKTAQAERAGTAARKLAKEQGYSKARQDQVAGQARDLVFNEFVRDAAALALKYGITKVPQLNDTGFIFQLVFDSSKPAGTPKDRFAYLFPEREAALVQVRLRPDLSTQERREAIGLIRDAVAMPDWKLPNGNGTYVVTGAPVIVSDLTTSISNSILLLLVGAVVVMGLTLLAVFRARLRLLPLVVALAATAMTFGGLSLVGASLTMASIGVLPVLIGLAVDYAIQLQTRLQEELTAEPAAGLAGAVGVVSRRGAPTIATAAAATAAGFAVLLLSPVPMVQGFGVLLVFGIAIAFLCALVLGTAVLALDERGSPLARALQRRRPIPAGLASAVRGAGELLGDNVVARGGRRVAARAGVSGRRAFAASVAYAVRRPGRMLAGAGVIALVGWVVGTQTRVESDVQQLVPQDLPALAGIAQLQESTGIGGEVDVVVRSKDLTDPKVFAWMTSFQKAVLDEAGFDADKGCGEADLCPAFSLPDLFRSSGELTKAQIEELLGAVPAYFSQGVITADRRTATLAFGIRFMSLERQKVAIDRVRDRLDPPPGVTAELAGLPVLAAEANARVSDPWRRVGTLVAGLLAVALVLLVALRSASRALVPLIPIVLATGWSGLVLWLMRIDLNPMSVTLGALVIAISTEFAVLLSERFRDERRAGHGVDDALARAYASTGAAVLASGVTAIAGFAVLVLSDIRLLRDFGAATVVDLSVSLLGVLIVLPAVLVLAERRAARELAAGRAASTRPALSPDPVSV